jgi:deoxyribodipyrimidine photo-lyase
VPTPTAVAERRDTAVDGTDPVGAVVWHREHLRVRDQPAVAAAADEADVVVPLFVFDPAFYGDDGLACDGRVRFLHECLFDLDDRYDTASAGRGGLTYAHGDPLAVLSAFVDAGWAVVAARTPTGRYGLERDEAARELGVRLVDGDGLVRDVERTRRDWNERVEAHLTDDRYEPSLADATLAEVTTGVTVAGIETTYDTTPEKSKVPEGGTTAAREALAAFVARIDDYPGSISSPLDARDGCSGLSPYIRFGCLSVRQVYQHVREHAPAGHGREMFESRLLWNRHYNQKLADWPGWLDTAVNPELEGFNREEYDPELVAAWKEGRTGYPMVDAAMRCLRGTGWLNFRMRAMAASAYYHLLQQPWRIGADWYHHHLIDSDAAINYTQWQSQAGLVGKPGLRLYNPRKQVRDQDPEGEWIREWVPELEGLPAEHLPQPEKTPRHVQAECGVDVGGPGADYPRPVVEYETAKERFWRRYEPRQAAAAARLGDEAVAKRASLSGGLPRAMAIAQEYGTDGNDDPGTQTDLTAF